MRHIKIEQYKQNSLERVNKAYAIKLKQLGFDLPTHAYYDTESNNLYIGGAIEDYNKNYRNYSAPSIKQAREWLNANFGY